MSSVHCWLLLIDECYYGNCCLLFWWWEYLTQYGDMSYRYAGGRTFDDTINSERCSDCRYYCVIIVCCCCIVWCCDTDATSTMVIYSGDMKVMERWVFSWRKPLPCCNYLVIVWLLEGQVWWFDRTDVPRWALMPLLITGRWLLLVLLLLLVLYDAVVVYSLWTRCWIPCTIFVYDVRYVDGMGKPDDVCCCCILCNVLFCPYCCCWSNDREEYIVVVDSIVVLLYILLVVVLFKYSVVVDEYICYPFLIYC